MCAVFIDAGGCARIGSPTSALSVDLQELSALHFETSSLTGTWGWTIRLVWPVSKPRELSFP